MPKFDNVMLDLETLATDSRALIVSIGAVYFNADDLGDTFYAVPDREEQQDAMRTISEQTLDWWSKQSPEAQKVLEDRTGSVEEVLIGFSEFMGNENVRVWGNGSDFDCVILGSLYEDFGIKRPWSYSNNRCFRTLKNIALMHDSHAQPQRRGTHHNALDDAIYQAECAIRYLKGKLK